MSIPSPRGLISRDSFLHAAWHTKLIWYIRTRFLRPTCSSANHQAAIFRNSRNVVAASCGVVSLNTGRIAERTNELERDPQILAIPTPRFARQFSTWGPPSQAAYFECHAHVRLRFKLASGFGEPWTRDGGIPQGCPLSMMFIVVLYLPWCWYLAAHGRREPQLYADNLKCVSRDPGLL